MTSHLKRLHPKKVIELGDGYAATAVNVCTFRHHAVVTSSHYQFASFYESPTRIIIVRRDLRTDELVFGAMAGTFQVQDVHNAISIGVDPLGYLHVAYDHHNHPLRYRRSLRPLDVTDWTEPLGMTGRNEGQVCYPSFIMGPGGGGAEPCFWFMYRNGGAGNGGICLKAYDAKTRTWHDLAHEFVTGHQLQPWSCSPYWNKAPFDSRGNLVLSWIWRVVQNASAGGDFIFNNNHAYARSPDGQHWFTSQGVELSLPITPVNAEVIVPTAPGSTWANLCCSAIDSRDRLHIVTYGGDGPDGAPQYRHLWQDGDRWHCDVLSNRDKFFGLLTWDAPMCRAEIVIDRKDYVYVLQRSDITGQKLAAQRLAPPAYTPPGDLSILWDEEVNFCEPVADLIRWRQDGTLSLLVQAAEQPELLADREAEPTPVRLVDWVVDDAL